MIVKDQPDSAHANAAKSSYAPVSARPGEPSNLLGSETEIETDMYAPPAYYSTPTPFYGRGYGESACRRFWRAFAVALFIWALLGMLAHSIFDLALVRRGRGKGSDGMVRDWPEFSRGEVRECVERADWPSFSIFDSNAAAQQDQNPLQNQDEVFGTPSATGAQMELYDPPYSANASFSLPADASLLYFLSRGSLAYGSVLFTTSAGPSRPNSDPNTVEVDVRVGYWTTEALERAAVCRLNRDDEAGHEGEHGVGIFTPRNWHVGRPIGMRDMLRFDVTVHLPAVSPARTYGDVSGFAARQPRLYNALSTDFSNFKHDFNNLQGVAFSVVDAKTSNAYIAAENLEVAQGSLKSSNGPITGTYNTSTALTIITSNARIAVDVEMHSERLKRPTAVILKTSNGVIDSTLNLHADSPSGGADSAFAAQAITSNARSSLAITQHPADAPLTVESKTSNSPARVALHPAFEGAFALRTSNSAARIDAAEHVGDPRGEGRVRTVRTDRIGKGSAEGRVWWGEYAAGKKGWVHVTSSNSQVELALREAEGAWL
ncbi:hypothetical protein M0805_009114 [Coniferiporia weirii]|nr:hypothetical protein M0805_009114 [Coniferiporia weirii]